MRVLKPEVAQDRRDKILNWVVYNYVSTGKPVSSDLIASHGGFNVSSATIRNILKELEDTGFLYQAHTSGGRIPSDKGYRSYVDHILRLQRMAVGEKDRLEQEYERRNEQLDAFLRHTSRTIADMSKWAGFVIPADIEDDAIKRMDLVRLSGKSVLMIVFVHSGILKHVPFVMDTPLDKAVLKSLSDRLNKALRDVPVKDVTGIIWKDFLNRGDAPKAQKELLKKIYDYFSSMNKEGDPFYLEGVSRIFDSMEEAGLEDIRGVARLLEEKERFSHMLRERLRDCVEKQRKLPASHSEKGLAHSVDITIGSENHIKEFNNFSLVSSSYCLKDKAVGLVGILGHKRMEYPKMITIVDSVSSMVEDILSEWEALAEED
ncbi:MAG TPA: heat-inducible transcription repressor HrcA [Elusimicrobia bacterium]|jgi:heat-inducible transcriptional repressor|nr:heat-inducible transcription repressor HrcA [Elusimicrobiota bacterium]